MAGGEGWVLIASSHRTLGPARITVVHAITEATVTATVERDDGSFTRGVFPRASVKRRRSRLWKEPR